MRLIDADALIERIKYSFHNHERVRIDTVTETFLTEYCSSTINPEDLRPKGEWIVCGDGENVPWMCSHCGKTTAHKYKVTYGKFCPNCGAKMEV